MEDYGGDDGGGGGYDDGIGYDDGPVMEDYGDDGGGDLIFATRNLKNFRKSKYLQNCCFVHTVLHILHKVTCVPINKNKCSALQ